MFGSLGKPRLKLSAGPLDVAVPGGGLTSGNRCLKPRFTSSNIVSVDEILTNRKRPPTTSLRRAPTGGLFASVVKYAVSLLWRARAIIPIYLNCGFGGGCTLTRTWS